MWHAYMDSFGEAAETSGREEEELFAILTHVWEHKSNV